MDKNPLRLKPWKEKWTYFPRILFCISPVKFSVCFIGESLGAPGILKIVDVDNDVEVYITPPSGAHVHQQFVSKYLHNKVRTFQTVIALPLLYI